MTIKESKTGKNWPYVEKIFYKIDVGKILR